MKGVSDFLGDYSIPFYSSFVALFYPLKEVKSRDLRTFGELISFLQGARLVVTLSNKLLFLFFSSICINATVIRQKIYSVSLQ